MISLIKADLLRILNKRSFQIVLAVTAALVLALVIPDRLKFWNGFVYAVNRINALTTTIPVIIGIASFLGIYADEFQSKSLQAAIGRGMPRRRLILSKIIVCSILTAIVFVVFFVFFVLLGRILGAHMSPEDVKILALATVSGAYIVICCTPLAAILLYATDNTALSVFAELLLISVIPLALEMMGSKPLIHNFHLDSLYVTGFANGFFADMMLTGGGFLRLLAGAVLYLGLAYLVSWLVFRKKELEL